MRDLFVAALFTFPIASALPVKVTEKPTRFTHPSFFSHTKTDFRNVYIFTRPNGVETTFIPCDSFSENLVHLSHIVKQLGIEECGFLDFGCKAMAKVKVEAAGAVDRAVKAFKKMKTCQNFTDDAKLYNGNVLGIYAGGYTPFEMSYLKEQAMFMQYAYSLAESMEASKMEMDFEDALWAGYKATLYDEHNAFYRSIVKLGIKFAPGVEKASSLFCRFGTPNCDGLPFKTQREIILSELPGFMERFHPTLEILKEATAAIDWENLPDDDEKTAKVGLKMTYAVEGTSTTEPVTTTQETQTTVTPDWMEMSGDSDFMMMFPAQAEVMNE